MATPLSVVVTLRLSEQLIVQGCPGVPMSMPRLETVIQIRPTNLRRPFSMRNVRVELRTRQTMIMSLKLGSLKNEAYHEHKLAEQLVFTPPPGKASVNNLLGIDIPLLMAIPSETPLLGHFQTWNASTVNQLCVFFTLGKNSQTETTYMHLFPVSIKRFDNLPIYRQFTEPVTHTRVTPNNQVVMDLSLPDTQCVGPMDVFNVAVKIKANNMHSHLRRNVKLKQLTFQLKEVCTCHEGGLTPRREMKICTTSKSFEDEENVLNTVGLSHTFKVRFPRCNDFLNLYSVDPVPRLPPPKSANDPYVVDNAHISREKVVDKLEEGIPITHSQGFTSTEGRLFRVVYEMNLKLKLSNAKDIEERFALVVLPYDVSSSQYLLPWIMHECEVAKQRFGKDAVQAAAGGAQVLSGFNTSPLVFYNNVNDWLRMGYPRHLYTSDTAVALDTQHHI